MVPDRMMMHDARYTGNWWLELEHRRGWFNKTFRLHVVLEIQEGWGNDVPPMPGRQKQLDWRTTSRRADATEIYMLMFANHPAFHYAPHLNKGQMP